MTEDRNKEIPPYHRLANYYDSMMDYIDYDIWVADIEAITAPYNVGKKWLDISCGTGSMAIRLAALGYKMKAVDISKEMIGIGKSKAREAGQEIDFEVGDMCSYRNHDRYDVILNLHDGLNYILDQTDIQRFMANSYSLLNPGGLLLFDVATPLLCQRHFRGYREILFEDESGGYERETSYDAHTKIAETVFTLNAEDRNGIEFERHIQRAYDYNEVVEQCKRGPFDQWDILDDETLEPASDTNERYIVIMRKNP